MAGDSLLDDVASSLPEDLRAFVDCRAETATLQNGPMTWLAIPDGVRGLLGGSPPVLTITPDRVPGSAILSVKAGWVGASLPARIADGVLSIDTTKLPFLAPPSIGRDIQRVVAELNARLAANGKALGQPSFGPGGMTLTKVDLPASLA